MHRPRFAHARSVRNGLERARLRHANRVYEAAKGGHAPTVQELVTIEPPDIRASRVFESADASDDGVAQPAAGALDGTGAT
jgi:hypothetical protein